MVSTASQPSLEDLGQHLSQVTFCVVDLETTGAGPEARITEIGAVKVRGGEVLGEFQTLVRPGVEIPAMIQVLTGITQAMVATAPPLEECMEAFHTFSAGCVLVAHNARFDVGFLKRAYREVGLSWRNPAVIDTVALSRCVMLAGEVRNHKLATLAQYFHVTTTPNHRALSDARATVDVLHALLERSGNQAVHTLEDLLEFLSAVTPARRAKRVWAADLPNAPGIYWFVHDGRDAAGQPRREILYVGKSVRLRSRVRSYFSAAEQRTRIHEMVAVATGVEYQVCATSLESEIRELRMIAAHAPRYNRRSKNQKTQLWLKLTREAFPRLSIVRKVQDDHADYWGPFGRRAAAEEAALALSQAFGIRSCTTRLSARQPSPACTLGEIGRCLKPCQLGPGATAYGGAIDAVRRAWFHDARTLVDRTRPRLQQLVAEQRYEEAAEVTQRVLGFHHASVRFHRVRALARCPHIVAAAPERDGWAIHVIRYGRLAGATWARTADVRAKAADAESMAETVVPELPHMLAASFQETETVAAWLETPGVRLLTTIGDWAWPIHAAIDVAELPQALLGTSPGESIPTSPAMPAAGGEWVPPPAADRDMD